MTAFKILFGLLALASLVLLGRLGATHAPAPIMLAFGLLIGAPLLGIAYRLGRRDGRLTANATASRAEGDVM